MISDCAYYKKIQLLEKRKTFLIRKEIIMAKPKLQSYIRYRASLVEAVLFGRVEITGPGATDYQLITDPRPVNSTTRTDMIMFILPKQPVRSVQCDITITGCNSSNAFGAGTASDKMSITALTAQNSGTLVTKSGTDPVYWKSVASVAVDSTNHGTAGESYDLWGVLKWNDDSADMSAGFADLMVVTSSDITPGGTSQPVPNRMDPAYTIISIRPNNTFAMSQRYVSNNYAGGIGRLRGRSVTLLQEMREDGGALVTEFIYLLNAHFNETPTSAPDNADVTMSATGFFDAELHYEP